MIRIKKGGKMHAIIRLKNGGYYLSAVFGYFNDKTNSSTYNDYCIVFNKEKTTLIKKKIFNPRRGKYLEKMVLIYDCDRTGWIINDNGYGCVEFLSEKGSPNLVEINNLPEHLINQCHELDFKVELRDSISIKSKKDIDNLMILSGCFHDAVIDKITESDDMIKVLFSGIWGCSIELVFSGDVIYSVESRDPEDYDPYWYGASIIMGKDYLILVDDEDVNEHDLDGFCWFKAKHISYSVIPD